MVHADEVTESHDSPQRSAPSVPDLIPIDRLARRHDASGKTTTTTSTAPVPTDVAAQPQFPTLRLVPTPPTVPTPPPTSALIGTTIVEATGRLHLRRHVDPGIISYRARLAEGGTVTLDPHCTEGVEVKPDNRGRLVLPEQLRLRARWTKGSHLVVRRNRQELHLTLQELN